MRLASLVGMVGVLALTHVSVDTELDADKAGWPCVVVVREHHSNSPRAGALVTLQLAAWEDGAVLLPATRYRQEAILLVAQLEPADLTEACRKVADTGFFEVERVGYAVPDSSYTQMIVRHEGKLAHHIWHENLSPGFGGSINDDADYLKFAKAWRAAASALFALTPVHVERLPQHLQASGQATYRGYDPRDPLKTPWLRARNWKNVEAGP